MPFSLNTLRLLSTSSRVWQSSEAISPLWSPWPDKAIKLFFTSPKPLFSHFYSASVNRGWILATNRLFKGVVWGMGTSNPGNLLLLGLNRSEEESCKTGCGRASSTRGVVLGKRKLPGSEHGIWSLNPAWTSYMPLLPHMYSEDNNTTNFTGLRFKFDTD